MNKAGLDELICCPAERLVEFEAARWEEPKNFVSTIAYNERSPSGWYETLNPSKLEKDFVGTEVLKNFLSHPGGRGGGPSTPAAWDTPIPGLRCGYGKQLHSPC